MDVSYFGFQSYVFVGPAFCIGALKVETLYVWSKSFIPQGEPES